MRGWQRGRQLKNLDIYQTKVEHTDQRNGSYGTDPDSYPALATTKDKLSVSFNSNKQTSINHTVKKRKKRFRESQGKESKTKKGEHKGININKQTKRSENE